MSDVSERINYYGDCLKVQKTRGGEVDFTIDEKKKAREFPEELVEKIVSMMPFPSLFKAIVLSKTWYFKFPLSSQRIQSLSPSLQSQISLVSHKWATYSPALLSREGILGFDRASSRWCTLMDSSYFPVKNWTYIACWGPVICIGVLTSKLNCIELYVTNAVTRGWRKLPNLSLSGGPIMMNIALTNPDTYKVLTVLSTDEDQVMTQVYDSSLRSWSRSSCVDIRCYPSDRASVYLDGKLYCVCGESQTDEMVLFIYDVEKDVWSNMHHSFSLYEMACCDVLRCGDKIMVAICTGIDPSERNPAPFLHTPAESISIFELDTERSELVLVASGPPECIMGVGPERWGTHDSSGLKFSSDADFIYCGRPIPGTPMLSLNLQNLEWDCIPPPCYKSGSIDPKSWMAASFQPGVSPFMIV